MKIRITPGKDAQESMAFRDMLTLMYASFDAGNIEEDGLSRIVTLHGEYDAEAEYGVHRLVRISPFDPQKRRYVSFVSVEIDGKSRNEEVCSYMLDPYSIAKNHTNGKETNDVRAVLAGKPLGLTRR